MESKRVLPIFSEKETQTKLNGKTNRNVQIAFSYVIHQDLIQNELK